MQAGLAMLAEKAQQVFAPDERDLRVVPELGCNFVTASRQRGTQAKHFSRHGNAQGQSPARLGTNRELGATLTQYENALCRLALAEQDSIPRTRQVFPHRVEGLQHVVGQVAEEAVWAQDAIEAAMLYRALHIRLDIAQQQNSQ